MLHSHSIAAFYIVYSPLQFPDVRPPRVTQAIRNMPVADGILQSIYDLNFTLVAEK